MVWAMVLDVKTVFGHEASGMLPVSEPLTYALILAVSYTKQT